MQYATAELSTVTSTFVEDAEAVGMAERLNVILQAASGGNSILALSLAGGGDGHTFVTSVERSPSPLIGVSLDEDNLIGCYLAASEEELGVAKAACVAAMLASTPPSQGLTLRIVDEQLAGASKGTRFMGMLVALWAGGGG